MPRLIFLDNTVLSNFGLVERADLLFRLWPGQVCSTKAALDEYQAGISAMDTRSEVWKDLPIVRLSKKEQLWMADLSPFLGAGEAACLAAALHRNGAFASDDRKARKIASHLNVPIFGTVGILLGSTRVNFLSVAEAQLLLEIMIAAGYRSPIQNLIEIE